MRPASVWNAGRSVSTIAGYPTRTLERPEPPGGRPRSARRPTTRASDPGSCTPRRRPPRRPVRPRAPGTAGGTGTRRGCGSDRAARRRGAAVGSASASGTTSSSARVYGCDGCVRTCLVGPTSTMRPRYITATRSAIVHASPRSCVTIRMLIFDSARSLSSRRRISPRTDASRFDTGSSATMTRGSSASAPAITTRCRCPPDSSCGNRRKNRSGGRRPARDSARATSSSSSPGILWIRSPSATES